MSDQTSRYAYHDARPTWANRYLWPVLEREARSVLRSLPQAGKPARAFDLGCGNGATSNFLAELGFQVTGVDLSETGIQFAQQTFPSCNFAVASVYDDLAGEHGRFRLVVSLEVVEHCFDPRAFARRLYDLVEPGGTAFVSTPYHGYAKNIALAVSGKMDSHFTALWDGGHIKFFSIRTLRQLLEEAGFADIRFLRVGRFSMLAKSMVAIARKPAH